MQEALLQFIWQYSLYRSDTLRTTVGDTVTVIHPGTLNRDAGPDFSNARIRIGKTLLAGNVELHIHSSDWARHSHDSSPAYSRIILHVVALHDELYLPAGAPVLELGPHIPQNVLEQYTHLLQAPARIPCVAGHGAVSPLTKSSWLARILVTRWERRLLEWQELLRRSGGDWRALYYWRLAANYGMRVNTEPFMHMAEAVPLNVLQRHHNSLQSLEALLFGAGGMTGQNYSGAYPKALLAEWQFLQHKYALQPIAGYTWKFMRMRPAAFPTVRIAQFAALFHYAADDVFSVLQQGSATAIAAALQQTASAYWDTRYTFDGAPGRPSKKTPGEGMVRNIIINTIAPLRFLQAYSTGDVPGQEKALEIIGELPAEENAVLDEWAGIGWKAADAAEGQAQLELYKHYCAPKRCLECAVGLAIIRRRPMEGNGLL